MVIGAGGLSVIKTQGQQSIRCGTPDSQTLLMSSVHQIRGNLHDIGSAGLQIEKFAEGGAAEGHLDSVHEWTSGPSFFTGLKLDSCGLSCGRIRFVRGGGLRFRDVERAGAEERTVRLSPKNKIWTGCQLL